MNTITMSTALDAKIAEIRAALQIKGHYTVSTCDYRNWDVQDHYTMLNLQRNPVNDFTLSCSVNHGVSDWVVLQITFECMGRMWEGSKEDALLGYEQRDEFYYKMGFDEWVDHNCDEVKK